MTNRAPIFIGGLMKSGTLLLRKLVARHRNVFGGLETHWFTPDMLDDWRDSSNRRQTWLREFYDVSDAEFAEIKAASKSGLDWFDRFMAACTARAGKSRWVEKTPDNILHLDLIREGWPDAQVIHVVRDYRDAFASCKRNQTGSLEDFLTKVRSIVGVIGDLAGTRSAIYLVVSYDRLVVESRETLRDVFDFLHEPWDEYLATYEGDDGDYRRVLEVTGKTSTTAMSLARAMQAAGVSMGGHTHTHRVLSSLSASEQYLEIERCRRLTRSRLSNQEAWPFAYAFGKRTTYDDRTISILADAGSSCAFSTKVDSAEVGQDRWQIPRIDPRDVDRHNAR